MHPEPFRRALHGYLQRHAYRNASTNDFLVAMNASSPRDLAFVAQPWLYQRGFPRLQIDATCAAARARITVRQTGSQWWPVLLSDKTLVDRRAFTLEQACTAPLPGPATDSYYEASYTDRAVDFIGRRFSSMSPTERDIVIQDEWAHSSGPPRTRYLPLFAQLDKRDSVSTLRRVFGMIATLEEAVPAGETGKRSRTYVRDHFSAIGNSLLRAVSGTTEFKSLRTQALQMLSFAKDPAAIAFAKRAFDSGVAFDGRATYLVDYTPSLAYAIGVRASQAAHESFLQKARAETDNFKASLWYEAYFSDADPALVPEELAVLGALPKGWQGRYLLKLAAVDPKTVWDYAVTHVEGPEVFNAQASDVIRAFAMVENNLALREGMARWFEATDMRGLQAAATQVRLEKTRARRDIESFFAHL